MLFLTFCVRGGSASSWKDPDPPKTSEECVAWFLEQYNIAVTDVNYPFVAGASNTQLQSLRRWQAFGVLDPTQEQLKLLTPPSTPKKKRAASDSATSSASGQIDLSGSGEAESSEAGGARKKRKAGPGAKMQAAVVAGTGAQAATQASAAESTTEAGRTFNWWPDDSLRTVAKSPSMTLAQADFVPVSIDFFGSDAVK